MNAISTQTAEQRRLAKLEAEILADDMEAFVRIGLKLKEIRENKLYQAEGYKSWSAYCASGRLDYKKTQADHYIRSSELRPKLIAGGDHLSLKSMVELCKCETDGDAKRVARQSVKEAKRLGVPVTPKLIAAIRDGDSGEAMKAEFTLDHHLEKLAKLAHKWRTSLEQVEEGWDEVATETLTWCQREVAALNRFLRS